MCNVQRLMFSLVIYITLVLFKHKLERIEERVRPSEWNSTATDVRPKICFVSFLHRERDTTTIIRWLSEREHWRGKANMSKATIECSDSWVRNSMRQRQANAPQVAWSSAHDSRGIAQCESHWSANSVCVRDANAQACNRRQRFVLSSFMFGRLSVGVLRSTASARCMRAMMLWPRVRTRQTYMSWSIACGTVKNQTAAVLRNGRVQSSESTTYYTQTHTQTHANWWARENKTKVN